MRVLGLNGIGSAPARFWITKPPMFSASPVRKIIAPGIHRNAPCTKLVGTNHSSTSDTTIGKTNNSGGAIGTPGRSSAGDKSAGTLLITSQLVSFWKSASRPDDIQKKGEILRHAARRLVIAKRAQQLSSHPRAAGKSSRPRQGRNRRRGATRPISVRHRAPTRVQSRRAA